MLQNAEGAVFTKMVYNETVSVVEAPLRYDLCWYNTCSECVG